MKKTVLAAVLATLATTAMADINVGVTLSATGPAASLGIPEKNTIDLLPKTIAGQKVNYIVLDDASDTTTAVKNAKKLKEVVENIPLTSIVLETDCPYMAPEPNRGKRNNSAFIRYVAEKIAELKGITYEEVVEQTEKNARDMYRL